jgi:hypothetical protein
MNSTNSRSKIRNKTSLENVSAIKITNLQFKNKYEQLPNLYEYKYRRLFVYKSLSEAEAFRGDIGII